MEAPSANGSLTERTLFFKNLGDQDWKELTNLSLTIGESQLQSQCFVVVVAKPSVSEFTKRYKREEVTVKNLEYGDNLLALSVIENDNRPAYIMNVLDGQFMVHYRNSPYTYNRCLKPSELSIEKNDNNAAKLPPLAKKKKQFRGIKNMGNTCFINAVFQSLLGIPLLTSYLANKK